MKKCIKILLKILLFPLFLIFNPFVSKVAKKIIGTFLNFYNNVFVFHTLHKVQCNHRIYCDEGTRGICLHGNLSLGRCNRIACINKIRNQKFNPILEFGDNVAIGDFCHIACVNHISIGDNCLIGSRVFIEDHSHGGGNGSYIITDGEKNGLEVNSKGPIIIGKNVWIGENVCVLPNVHIGENSVIGAGSVVTHDVEANSVYAGNPARKIR